MIEDYLHENNNQSNGESPTLKRKSHLFGD